MLECLESYISGCECYIGGASDRLLETAFPKEASEKYELQKGGERHCVEGAHSSFTLVRCITANPNSLSSRGILFETVRVTDSQFVTYENRLVDKPF